jgi:hypothetical protein
VPIRVPICRAASPQIRKFAKAHPIRHPIAKRSLSVAKHRARYRAFQVLSLEIGPFIARKPTRCRTTLAGGER